MSSGAMEPPIQDGGRGILTMEDRGTNPQETVDWEESLKYVVSDEGQSGYRLMRAGGCTMSDSIYPVIDESIARRRRELTVETRRAFSAFSRQVFAEGALPAKVKQLIAVAVAHVTQCPYCIDAHAQLAVKHGASDEEIMEAIWVASEMRAGGAYAHSALALRAMEKARSHSVGSEPSEEKHAV